MTDELKQTLKSAMVEAADEQKNKKVPLVAFFGIVGILAIIIIVITLGTNSTTAKEPAS